MAVRGSTLRAAVLPVGLVIAAVILIVAGAVIGAGAAGGRGMLIAAIVVFVMVTAVYIYCDRLALAAMLARPVSEVEHPELYRLVRELSKAARLPVPRLYLSPAEQPNSFTVGRGPRSATLCCTEGLLRVLDEDELRGVLGHEFGHVSGRDLLASTVSAGLAIVITFPAGAVRFLPGRSGIAAPPGSSSPSGSVSLRGTFEALLMLVLGPVAALVIRLAVPSEREYRADAAGARLAGDPVALASALRKIESGTCELPLPPDARLTSVGHLMIASPFQAEGFARLFLTHPPAGERVRRLEALAGYRR
jgi:heat shock protein HtpX